MRCPGGFRGLAWGCGLLSPAWGAVAACGNGGPAGGAGLHAREAPALEARSDAGTPHPLSEAGESPPDPARASDGSTGDAAQPGGQPFRARNVVVHRVSTARLDTWRALVMDLAMKDTDVPPTSHPRLEWASGAARELAWDGESSVVAPLRLLFADVANSYCFLAVIRTAVPRADVLPMTDSCKGVDLAAEADLNDDGLPDFVFDTRIPSNRYAAIVVESQAYVSRADATYCYSAGVSRALLATHPPLTPAVVRAAVDKEVARLGPSVLDCMKAP
jgi:hypothetical protein